MAEETVDTLELVISAKATDAADKVRSLSTSVSDFGKEISSYISKMGDLANVLERIADAAKGLSAIKNIQDVIGRAASAASKAKASAVGKAFQPIVPPKRPSDTVRGGTRLARTQGGGAYRYDVSADDLARQLNAKYNTTYSNKALSAEIQRIRNAQMTGGGGTQETMGLAGMIAKTAQIKGASDGLVQAMNSVFKTLDVTLEEAVYLAKQYGTSRLGPKKRKELDADYAKAKENQYRDLSDAEAERIIHGYGGLDAANAALRKAGATFQVRYGRGGSGIDSLINGTNVREIGEEAFMLRSALAGSGVDVDNPQIEDIFYALDRAKNNRHGAFMSEYGFGANVPEAQLEQMLTGDLFEQLTDMIGAGKPEDLEAPIREAKTAVENAKKEAEEAARILREENEAWKSQASWNREQDARYKDEYGGREKKWQMEADWRAYEAENAEPADDPQRLREEIAGFKAQEFVDDNSSITTFTDGVKSAAESAKVFVANMVEAEHAATKSDMVSTLADGIRQVAQEEAEAKEEAARAAAESEAAAKANEAAARAAEAEADAKERSATAGLKMWKIYNTKTGQFDIIEWQNPYEEAQASVRAANEEKPEETQPVTDPLAEMERKMPHIDVQDLMENATPGDILQMKLDNVRNALESEGAKMQQDPAKIASLAEQYQRLTDKLERYKDAMREAGEAEGESSGKVGKLRGVLDALKETVSGSRLGKNMSQLFRVAKLRLFRDAVKAVTAAIKEGIGNLYQWSKMNNGHFAGAMDMMASKFMLIKNSVATAVAPLIESFVPVIAQVAQWANQASNALAQFFAMLTGQNSWTMATESAEEWAAATKTGAGNTKKAEKEAKDLLADWDELNIIQQEANDATGGGSGNKGKKPPDYASMFKEMTVFDEWTEHFEAIRDIVIAIGAGIALWFATDAVHDFLGQIGIAGDAVDGVFARIKKGVTGAVLLGVSFVLANDAGKTIANEGMSGTAILESLGSLAAGALGGYMLGSAIAGPAGGVIGAIAGLAIDVIIGINAYYEERNNNAKQVIREMLEDQVYNFDLHAEAEQLDIAINNAEAARKEVRQQLTAVFTDMDVIKLGLDNDETWNKLYEDVVGSNGLISKIQKEIEADNNIITFNYQFKLRTLPEGEETPQTDTDAFKRSIEAGRQLDDYFTSQGEKFAECFVKGEQNKLNEKKRDLALSLIEHISAAEAAMERARGESQAEAAAVNTMKGTNKYEVMGNMRGVLKNYENTMADTLRQSAEKTIEVDRVRLAGLKEAAKDETLSAAKRKEYADSAAELELQVAKEWAEYVGTDYNAKARETYREKEVKMILDFVKANFSDLTFKDVRDRIEPNQLADYADTFFGNGATLLMQEYGMNLSDFLSEAFIKDAARYYQNTGDSEYGKTVLAGWGVTQEKIAELFKESDLSNKAETAKAETEAKQAAEESAKAAAEAAKAAEDAKLASEKIQNATGKDEALQAWWDAYRNYTSGNYEPWEYDMQAGYNDEQMKREALLELMGIEADEFQSIIDNYLNGRGDNPFDEEDLPDWLFGWTDEPSSEGATISGGGGNPGTAWFSGPQDESFEMDASGSGLATESSLDNLKGVNTTGFASVKDILETLNKTMGDVNDNTRRVAEKDFSVNVYPTSGWGGFNQRSGEKREAVTGGP